MKIVTIEGFGRAKPGSLEHPGYIYEGEAYLLRFSIRSPEHFFRTELEQLCSKLSICPRQIMEMTIYGDGFGLYDVRVLISFEERPNERAIDELQLELSEATDGEWSYDDLDLRFGELMKAAKPALKRRIALSLQRQMPVKLDEKRLDGLVRVPKARGKHDSVLRLYWSTTCIWDKAWADVNLFLAETLRSRYDLKRIVRLRFRAIPDTEDEYAVEIDVLVGAPLRRGAARKRLRSHPMVRKKKPIGSASAQRRACGPARAAPKEVVFAVEDPLFAGLDEKDKEILRLFHRLPLQRRIHFWQKHLAPFFT